MKIEVELSEELSSEMWEVAQKFDEYGIHSGPLDGTIILGENQPVVMYETCSGNIYRIDDDELRFEGSRQSLRSGSRFIDIHLSPRTVNVVLKYGEDYSEARQKRVFEDLEYTLHTRNPLTLPFYFPHAGFEPSWLGMTESQVERYEQLKENQEPYFNLISVLTNKAGDDEFIFDPEVNEIRNDNIVYTGE